MSRTLFWYILKDLLRIFLMASGVLAGIMSFGGLLKPLTDHGLSVAQVIRMLGYFMPAMNTYALPIAALYATTMVYGRLAADNELVACRAAGISHLSMALPALVLGLSVSILSLLLLCFIVPAFMLKAEKVVYSNVAQIIANEIERTHQLKLDQGDQPVTVFAEKATVRPPDQRWPDDQVVELQAPMFITYEPSIDKSQDAIRTPKDFFIGKTAETFIHQDQQTDELTIYTELTDGRKFPRTFSGSEGGVDATIFAAKYPSEVRENTNFMNVWRLKELLNDESQSRRVQTILQNFIEAEQSETFLKSINDELASPVTAASLVDTDGETYTITRGNAVAEFRDGKLLLGSATPNLDRPVHLRLHTPSGDKTYEAQQISIAATPDNDKGVFYISIDMADYIEHVNTSEVQGTKSSPDFTVNMPNSIKQIQHERDAKFYVRHANFLPGQQKTLARARYIVSNGVRGELHKRASFALSCLILVMVGCALGMMFRSGNFLSAFALSVVPALISIALIVTGQHTCENVPWDVTHWQNTLGLGLALIWSGNIAVAIIATVLLTRLQRQ